MSGRSGLTLVTAPLSVQRGLFLRMPVAPRREGNRSRRNLHSSAAEPNKRYTNTPQRSRYTTRTDIPDSRDCIPALRVRLPRLTTGFRAANAISQQRSANYTDSISALTQVSDLQGVILPYFYGQCQTEYR